MQRQVWDTARTEPTTQVVSCDLDATPTREVRQLLRELLTGRDGIMVDDTVLVADELISNAHQHGRGPRSCRLALIDQGRCVRIEVDDASPAQPAQRTPDRTGGRGLILVDRLASSWGVRNHPGHKTVWAELALDRPGSSGHAPHLSVAPPRW
jgi:two-component sensor histidine kinase